MNNNLRSFLVVISCTGLVTLSGCATAPDPASGSAAADVQRVKSESGHGPTELDPQLVAAMTNDDFWRLDDQPSIDDDGRLVYRVSLPVVDDGNFNREELNGYRAQSQTLRYDPLTGLPISPVGRPFVRIAPRNPEGTIAPRGAQPDLQPAPRINPAPRSRPSSSGNESRRGNNASSRDSRR